MARKEKRIETNGHGHEIGTASRSTEYVPSPSSNEIAERAYWIYESEGRVEGRDQEHWLQAERELMSERQGSIRTPLPSSAAAANVEPRSARQAKAA